MKQFDVVTDCSDHKYFSHGSGSKSNAFAADANGPVCKKIMQEWSILKKNLPETIFVQAYEGRIDLLRAAIIGADGTPYQDNVFFFDLAFSNDYPNTPPQVHYRSHGLAVNPNLYSNGYVCLSILNTWDGSMRVRWMPTESSVLQILVSIQGLVLNEKPFYNEPGSKPARYWQDYNRDVFLLSCKTMMFNLKNQPKNFEGFVKFFYGERTNSILKACKDYMNDEATPVEFTQKLRAIYPELEESFSKIDGVTEVKKHLPDDVKEENKRKKIKI